MNQLDFIVFDMETGGLDPKFHECIELAAQAYNARTLEPYPAEAGGTFLSLMKPIHFDRLEPKALEVNKKTKEELMAAPDQKSVWLQFIQWVNRYNPKKSKWTAPIACGKNIRGFDLKFVDELNKLYAPKKEKELLFSERIVLDLEDLMFHWFENEAEPAKHNMDALREYFGLSSEAAHSAMGDVKQEGQLIMRFLKLHRRLQAARGKDNTKLIKFKGCFAKGAA